MNMSTRVKVAGSSLLVLGASICVTMAGEPAGAKADALMDSFHIDSPRGGLSSPAWNGADAMEFEKGMLLAQAGTAGSGAGGVFVGANNGGAVVGVSKEFSTWSDLTAMFRPSRWGSPFREGGSLSWLNYKAWANVPGRTGKVLLGEAIVIGTTIAIIENNDGNKDNRTVAPVVKDTSSSINNTNDRNDDGESQPVVSDNTGSGGGGPAPSPVVVPDPVAPDAGGEMPW